MNNKRFQSIVRQAGGIIRRQFGQVHAYRTKSTPFDPVTVVDVQVERFLVEQLTALLPGSRVLAEETEADAKTAELLWIVDPVDGTVNFLHGFPFVAVSVALQVRGVVERGAVFNPMLGEYFHARRGRGAWRNGVRLHASERAELAGCLLATGFPYDFATCAQNNVAYFTHFHRLVQGIRRPGSAALDLCYVAAGVLDGFWELGLKPWDTAAGALIVQEAGGLVTTMDGLPHSPGEPTVLAAGPAVHALMLRDCMAVRNTCAAGIHTS